MSERIEMISVTISGQPKQELKMSDWVANGRIKGFRTANNLLDSQIEGLEHYSISKDEYNALYEPKAS